MYSEGISNKIIADNIILAHARDFVYKIITTPNLGCKTCGRIPIRYPNTTDGTNDGGILKIDFISDDDCIGSCVGPNLFDTTPSPKSAAKQLGVPGLFEGPWILTITTTVALLGYFSI